MTLFLRIAATAALMALPGAALAHTGIGATSDIAHGFAHPISGLDHVLAMVAVGLYAALRGGRALWLVPASFLGVMAIGGALGMAGVALPQVEFGIALSVIALGLAVALRISLPMLIRRFWSACSQSSTATRMAPRCRMPPLSLMRPASCWRPRCCMASGSGSAAGRLGDQGWRATQTAGGAIAVAGAAILLHAF